MNVDVCPISAGVISVTTFSKTIMGKKFLKKKKKSPLDEPRNIKVSKMLDLKEIGSGTAGGFTDSCAVKLFRERHGEAEV